jgi:hypothetical protein
MSISLSIKASSLKFLGLAISGLLILSNTAWAQKKTPDKILGNKIYTIELTAQGGKKAAEPESDELTFKTDKLASKLMKTDFDFEPASYTITADSSDAAAVAISFESESKNANEETLKWTGTVKGIDIEGTAVWTTKKGKVKKEYSFTGIQKGKKKK